MSDKIKIVDELTEKFIYYQWRLDNPMPSVSDDERMRAAFMSDPMFHRKVQALVVAVFDIVSPYIEEKL